MLCNGGNTGTITVTASTGARLLTSILLITVSYVPVKRLFQYQGLVMNRAYNIVVKDTQGCSKTYSGNPVVISQPTPLTQVDTATAASCANVFDGKIYHITAAGGVCALFLFIKWWPFAGR